ncbi:hypothetical protein C8Q80DRAFT_1120419 [Daedaleopsis nitida]|nr:hypothetical protein C8Q80DRAFT_1120419 [Daedaleopsis nitida]
MPVDEQIAITLYRFGHYRNTAGLQQVANWASCGKGTGDLVTCRVITAILCRNFLDEMIRYPTPEEKEKAKEWVETHSCKAWWNGWCMVDGTLVPLDERLFWYGESYFDRKCNYSLNVQATWKLHVKCCLYVVCRILDGAPSSMLCYNHEVKDNSPITYSPLSQCYPNVVLDNGDTQYGALMHSANRLNVAVYNIFNTAPV